MSTASSNSDKGRIVAIASYITIIGWIIALVMHLGNKTSLGAYHLRQTLGLWIVGVIIGIVFGILSRVSGIFGYVGSLLWLCLLILLVCGLLSAINGEEKPMPVIGAKIQDILGSAFN